MLTNSPFLPFPDAPLGVYPFPYQSNAPGTLLLRKLIYPRKSVAKLCVLLGCISVPSSAECARHAPSSEADLSLKIHRTVVTCCLGGSRPSAHNRAFAAQRGFPSLAGLGRSFSDGCDTSPTETLRNLQESSSDWFAVYLTARGRQFRYMKRGRHEGPRQRHWPEPER